MKSTKLRIVGRWRGMVAGAISRLQATTLNLPPPTLASDFLQICSRLNVAAETPPHIRHPQSNPRRGATASQSAAPDSRAGNTSFAWDLTAGTPRHIGGRCQGGGCVCSRHSRGDSRTACRGMQRTPCRIDRRPACSFSWQCLGLICIGRLCRNKSPCVIEWGSARYTTGICALPRWRS